MRPETTLKSTTQIICPEHHLISNLSASGCYPLYFSTNNHLPVPNVFLTHNKGGPTGQFNKLKNGNREPFLLGDDIDNSIGPSRFSLRAIFMLPGDRNAVEKEIADLLTPHGEDPPAMAVLT